jgi:ribosome-binding protein aMBF1 (putative translation factor)
MLCCELCGEATECVQKEIEGEELVVCDQCSRPADEKPGVVEISDDDFEETII